MQFGDVPTNERRVFVGTVARVVKRRCSIRFAFPGVKCLKAGWHRFDLDQIRYNLPTVFLRFNDRSRAGVE